MNTFIKPLATAAAVFVMSATGFAQKGKGYVRPGSPVLCEQKIGDKSGTVHPPSPGVFTLNDCESNNITINILKYNSAAKGEIKFYVNNVEKTGMLMSFPTASVKSVTKSVELKGVKGKKITVKIYNKSITDLFKYQVAVYTLTSNLIDAERTGTILGMTQKKFDLRNSCTPYRNIKVTRTGGNARLRIRIYYWHTAYDRRLSQEHILAQGDAYYSLQANADMRTDVVLENLSVGNTFSYTIEADCVNR